MAHSDFFVILDTVQFPRRGWVHRNRFTTRNGLEKWVGLSLEKGNRDTTMISDLTFKDGAREQLESRFEDTQIWNALQANSETFDLVFNLDAKPSQYLRQTLEFMLRKLNLNSTVLNASDLGISESLKSEDRLIAIVRELGGSSYLNLSGGIHLYDQRNFNNQGISLKFLDPYQGIKTSILERFIFEGVDNLRKEILGYK
jgi:hypothetical protein